MPDPDTTVEEAAPTEEAVRIEPTEVTAEVVRTEDEEAPEPDSARDIVIRHVLERQLGAGQGLSTRLVDAATDLTVAVAHAPVAVVAEIRDGATLPDALAHGGTSVRDAVIDAGGRVRTAVGEYVGQQATLPNAVIVGAAGVAETVARAQGTVTASAVNAAFTLATTASRGGDVREEFGVQRRDVGSAAAQARDRISESVQSARAEIRDRIQDYDTLVDAFV